MNETSVDVIDAAGLESRSVVPCHNDFKDVVKHRPTLQRSPPLYKKTKGGGGRGGRDILNVSTTVKGEPRTKNWTKGS